MISLKHYPSMEQARQDAFKKLRELKNNKQYAEALKLIDDIESNLYTIYDGFSSMNLLNDFRSSIYSKQGLYDKKIYYTVLSDIGELLQTVFTGQNSMLTDYYYTDKFIDHYNDTITKKAIKEYIQWLKPIIKEMETALYEIKQEFDNTYFDYEYKSSKDLEIYLYTKNVRLTNVLNIIKDNPINISGL